MYQVGDWIFYGNTGACQVTDVSEQKIPGMDQEVLYYTLRPLDESCTISTPARGKVFMRPLITKAEAEALIQSIPKIDVAAYHNSVLRQLSDHYEAALNTHDCFSLIKMTMSIHAKREQAELQKRKLGAVDEKFMKRAEELLFGELAIALGIEKEEVPTYIQSRIGA